MSEPMYANSKGQEIPIKGMAVPHLKNTIAKLKREGYISPAKLSLYVSGSDMTEDEVLVTMGLTKSTTMGNLEAELQRKIEEFSP